MAVVEAREFLLKDGRKVNIRSGRFADAQPALDFLKIILRDGEGMVLLAGESEKTLEQQHEWLKDLVEHPNKLLLVAECEGEIIGILDLHSGKRKRLAHSAMFGISILPQWRGCGVGKHLISTMLDFARKNSELEKIALNVLASNLRAQALYKSFGFVEEGVGKRAIKLGPGKYEDDISMALFVKPMT